jgi:hypothetical protein
VEAKTDAKHCAGDVLAIGALQQQAGLVDFTGSAVFYENLLEFEEKRAVVLVQGVLPGAAAR